MKVTVLAILLLIASCEGWVRIGRTKQYSMLKEDHSRMRRYVFLTREARNMMMNMDLILRARRHLRKKAAKQILPKGDRHLRKSAAKQIFPKGDRQV